MQKKVVYEAKKWRQQVVNQHCLDAIDQTLLRQVSRTPDASLSDLSVLVNLSITAVKKRMAKQRFRNALTEVLKTTDQRLQGLAHAALDRLRELMNSGDERIVLASSCKILDIFHSRRTEIAQPCDRIHRVQFGPDGQIYQETIEGCENPKLLPSDLLGLQGENVEHHG